MNWNLSTIVFKESFIASPSHHLELSSLQKWSSESFSSFVSSKYGVFLFREFLKSEFSHENLDFWVAVQEFNKSKPQEMVSKANMIYNNFIASKAPNQVNLDYETRSTIQNQIESKNVHQRMFDRAQRHIQYIIEQDSFARFRNSDQFIRALDQLKMSKMSK